MRLSAGDRAATHPPRPARTRGRMQQKGLEPRARALVTGHVSQWVEGLLRRSTSLLCPNSHALSTVTVGVPLRRLEPDRVA